MRICEICAGDMKSQGECKTICIECQEYRQSPSPNVGIIDHRIRLSRPTVLKALTLHGHDAHSAWCGIMLKLEEMDVAAWLLSYAVPAISAAPDLCTAISPQVPIGTPVRNSTSILPRIVRMRSDCTTGHTGIDVNRGRYRARVRVAGREVFNRSFDDLEAAVNARAEFMAGAA